MKKIVQAITAHKDGKLDEAEKLYRQILKIDSENLDANNNLGILLHTVGKFKEAEKLYNNAIKVNPNFPEAYYNLGITMHKLNKLEEAERVYKKAIELKPDYVASYHNLGNILIILDKLKEAEEAYKKALEFNPSYAEIYNKLGSTMHKLNKLQDAETNLRKAIELKPDFAEAYNNLGKILYDFNKLHESETSYKKAIALKTDFFEAYNNLGTTFSKLKKIKESEESYRKALELKPDYFEANYNLKFLLKFKEVLSVIKKPKINKKKNILKSTFISNRPVESELIECLYKIKTTELDNMRTDIFFGNGGSSNFSLFDEDFLILKKLKNDLIKIMTEAVKSEVFVIDSFLNIFGAGAGSRPHTHITFFDDLYGFNNQKFSLQYYLSVGDQNSSNPGIFEMKDPVEKILPSNNMIMIIPANRTHSAVYNGKKDRVMIGVNFYSLN